mmetsp:Transcript_23766/g.50890  ORF Transcript_23766/g.50890 Transcript_23766/m.50890 type:complete len:242 (-) Transcript_23766:482-1207(-)
MHRQHRGLRPGRRRLRTPPRNRHWENTDLPQSVVLRRRAQSFGYLVHENAHREQRIQVFSLPEVFIIARPRGVHGRGGALVVRDRFEQQLRRSAPDDRGEGSGRKFDIVGEQRVAAAHDERRRRRVPGRGIAGFVLGALPGPFGNVGVRFGGNFDGRHVAMLREVDIRISRGRFRRVSAAGAPARCEQSVGDNVAGFVYAQRSTGRNEGSSGSFHCNFSRSNSSLFGAARGTKRRGSVGKH